MKLSYEGIGQWAATFACDDLAEGELVKVSANGTVAACAAGDDFCGMVLSVGRGGDAWRRGPGRHGHRRVHRTGRRSGTGPGLERPQRRRRGRASRRTRTAAPIWWWMWTPPPRP